MNQRSSDDALIERILSGEISEHSEPARGILARDLELARELAQLRSVQKAMDAERDDWAKALASKQGQAPSSADLDLVRRSFERFRASETPRAAGRARRLPALLLLATSLAALALAILWWRLGPASNPRSGTPDPSAMLGADWEVGVLREQGRIVLELGPLPAKGWEFALRARLEPAGEVRFEALTAEPTWSLPAAWLEALEQAQRLLIEVDRYDGGGVLHSKAKTITIER